MRLALELREPEPPDFLRPYLSVKTVEMPLGRTYRKLDVHSRAQLAAALGVVDARGA